MKFLTALLTATIAASPLAATVAEAAPQRHEERRTQTTVRERPNGRTVVTQRTVVRQPAYRSWKRGDRFDNRRAGNYRIVNDYRSYRLATPPRGYRWVRSNNDAVLIAIGNGQVREVRGGAFRR